MPPGPVSARLRPKNIEKPANRGSSVRFEPGRAPIGLEYPSLQVMQTRSTRNTPSGGLEYWIYCSLCFCCCIACHLDYSLRHKKIAPCPIAPFKLIAGII